MPGVAIESVLRWVALAGTALLALNLFRLGLSRRYPAFFAFTLYHAVGYTALPLIDIKSSLYAYVWVGLTVVDWVFYAFIVLELCRLVLEKYQGLYSLGKWMMYAGLVVSVAVSALSMLAGFNAATPQKARTAGRSLLVYLYATDRGVTFCLAIFLLLMLFLLSRYPVPLNRNVLIHATLYTIYFLANSLNEILRTVFGISVFTALDTGLTAIAAACVFAWLLLLNQKGEEVRASFAHFKPETEDRILFHLDTLNSTLLKVGRK